MVPVNIFSDVHWHGRPRNKTLIVDLLFYYDNIVLPIIVIVYLWFVK